MSQMIDGARDEYDALDPLAAEPPSRGARGRRGRRPVIVDESYGDEGFGDPETAFDDDPFPDQPPPRRSAPRSTELARPRRGGRAKGGDSAGGNVWMLAGLATLIWIGAVLGFSAGLLRLPLDSLGGLLAAAQSLDPRVQVMVLALMVAPLGVILQTALTARRSQRMAADAQRLNRLIDQLASGGARANAAPGELREEAEAAARAFNALEAGFAEAEERAQAARARLEAERAALAKLAEDLDGHVSRISRSLSPLTGVDTERAAAFAEMVAAAMTRARPGDMDLRSQDMREPDMRAQDMRAQDMRASPRRDDPLDDHFDDRLDGSVDEAADPELGETPEEYDERMDAAEYDARMGGSGVNGRYPGDARNRSGGESPREEMQRLAEAAKHLLDSGDAGRDLEGRELEGGRGGSAARRRSMMDDDLDDHGDHDLDEEEYEEDDLPEEDADHAEPIMAGNGQFDWSRLIRAANFPDSEEDRETLEALYAVLGDPEAAELLQAAEDALSSLADIGLFMEDMQPRHAPVELWRAYVVDQARDGVADLGGVRDAHAVDDVGAALEEKPDFDRSAQRFMDAYEVMLSRLFNEAPSPRMAVELADTRSGRAYMLLGRAMGRFG